jgi:uncharacterized protein YcfJ
MNTKAIFAIAAAAALTACATPAPRSVAAPAPPENLTKVYFYPQQGQSDAQQDRDRYECYNWSAKQTGFDPSRRIAPGEARDAVVPQRDPNSQVVAAGATGAVIGAIAAPRGDTGKGALIGAVAGAMLGAVAANADANQPPRAAPRTRGDVRYEQEAAGYRRAMSACLEGRGYSVR